MAIKRGYNPRHKTQGGTTAKIICDLCGKPIVGKMEYIIDNNNDNNLLEACPECWEKEQETE